MQFEAAVNQFWRYIQLFEQKLTKLSIYISTNFSQNWGDFGASAPKQLFETVSWLLKNQLFCPAKKINTESKNDFLH